LNFNFNGWAKYKTSNWTNIFATVANFLDIPLTQVMYKGKAVIVEGGAIDSNGRGTLLTSEECLHPDIQVQQISPKQITKRFFF
jgi:agmatine deiminase